MNLQKAFDAEPHLLKRRIKRYGEADIGYIDDIGLRLVRGGVHLFLVIRYGSDNREVGVNDFGDYEVLEYPVPSERQ